MTQLFSKDKSKVRLVIYFKPAGLELEENEYEEPKENEYEEPKKNESQVIYSLFNDDKRGKVKTIEAMKRRIIEKKYLGQVKTAIFYDNTTGSELDKMVF
jgi:hypothetical protein